MIFLISVSMSSHERGIIADIPPSKHRTGFRTIEEEGLSTLNDDLVAMVGVGIGVGRLSEGVWGWQKWVRL